MLVGVESTDHRPLFPIADSLEELAQLAATAGADVVATISQRLDHPHPTHYIGKGKLQELVDQRAQLGATMVIFDDELSPSQARNLEKALQVKVLDRTMLILDIFAGRAATHEGRLQVELAQHEYLLPRLAGQWSHLERLGGGIGTRGPGESQLETDRRLIRRRIDHLKGELEQVLTHRALYQRRRQTQGLPVASLVGYTNAGKSTLMNALAHADVLAESKLFATLDPTTRRVTLPNKQELLLTDTVGFIQKLPTQLVAAFRATLDELTHADVLLHVIDLTHPRAAEQAQTVNAILKDLGLEEKPTIIVANKVDLLASDPLAATVAAEDMDQNVRDAVGENKEVVAVSAERGWGLQRLKEAVTAMVGDELKLIAVRIPYTDSSLVNLFRQYGHVTRQAFDENGTLLRGRIPARLEQRFQRFKVR
ncbi:MAG: GTPase HflX [Chloroflexi bacterium]|nr:GTPase HflX [Chloroflexota bacterium]